MEGMERVEVKNEWECFKTCGGAGKKIIDTVFKNS